MIKLTSILAAAALLLPLAANAQGAYMGDTGHYLQLPQGAQASTSQNLTGRVTFNGQGMGQGQLQTQQASLQPLGGVPSQTTMVTTQVSPRLLPQGASTQVTTTQVPVAMPMQKPIAAQPAAPQTARLQPASMPSAQALAAVEPAAGGSTFDGGTNVRLSTFCGDRASNHRQHKGINTSTTVGNSDCFD